LVGWHAGAVPLPPADVIFAQLAFSLNYVIICIQSAHWHGLLALFWLSINVTRHHLAVVPQSGAEDQFYFTVYYYKLNSNCDAQSI
jgi:hypothetical protein